MTRIDTFFMKQSPAVITITGLVFVVILGAIDFSSGYEIGFSIFYLAPIVFVTWYAGRQRGLLAAIISALVWFGADHFSGHVFSRSFIPFWNMLVRLGFFLIVVTLLSQLKLAYEKQKRMTCELRDSIDKTRILSGLIPICAWCKKIRTDSGYWQQVETYITENSEASFTHGMCPECKRKELQSLHQQK